MAPEGKALMGWSHRQDDLHRYLLPSIDSDGRIKMADGSERGKHYCEGFSGHAFLHSRSRLRWLFAVAATTVVFFTVHTYLNPPYHRDFRGGRLAGTAALADTLTAENGQDSLLDYADEHHRPPPWISTPSPFNVAQVPGYNASTIPLVDDAAAGLHPRLQEAMLGFLHRPVLSHEQAIAQNEAACPSDQLSRQVNADQLNGDRDKWLAVDEAAIVDMRLSLVEFLRNMSDLEGESALIGPGLGPEGKPVEKGSRGLVLTAGNHRTVERAIACIKVTQKLGWKGAIEVWHFDHELQNERDQQTLKDLGASVHQVMTEKVPGHWKNFEIKAEAIRRSSFDEVLYLDSDNFPLSDVSPLFDEPLFTDPRGGQTVFWPDLNRDHPENAIHRVLGIPCHDAWQLDSGQVLIKKSGNAGLNLASLYLAQYMQTKGDFWFSGGDKDTFRYAFLALGIPFTPAPRWLSLLGSSMNDNTYCGATMLQFGLSAPRPDHADPSDPTHPEPLFAHSNLVKHMPGGRKGNVFTQMRRLAPTQDDVRTPYRPGQPRPLDHVAGGARTIFGRGLCSDIWTIGNAANVETVQTKEVFGGLMQDFEEEYFRYSQRPGAWR